MRLLRRTLLAACLALGLASGPPAAASDFITVASTTSTEHSGLFGHILPRFTADSGIAVRIVAQGTGQALETGRRGDADVVLVHDLAAEERFVAEGHGVARLDVMSNDFVIVGPAGDPAGVAAASSASAVMAAIAAAGAPFASRGDDSGTHAAEKALWAAAGIVPADGWYLSTGSGMGATLNTAAQVPAYALTDRGTWLSFRNRGPLTLLFAGDPSLRNPYGVILVNPVRHPHVKAAEAQAFIDWLVGEKGQAAIANFTIDGERPFVPAATP